MHRRCLSVLAMILFLVTTLGGCSGRKHMVGSSCYLSSNAPFDVYAKQVMPALDALPKDADIHIEYDGDLTPLLPSECYFLRITFSPETYLSYLEKLKEEQDGNEAFINSHSLNFYMYPKNEEGDKIPFHISGFCFDPEFAVEVPQGAKTAIIRLIGFDDAEYQIVYLCFYDDFGSSMTLDALLTVEELFQSFEWN